MESLWRVATFQDPNPDDYKGVEFWSNPERSGWLTKQGDYIRTWRRRWFVLKQGKLFWFKDAAAASSRSSVPRGVVPVGRCLTVKGAEDVLNKPYAFELATGDTTMYFIADSEKEKEDWINSIGRSIVQHSRSVTDSEVVDYESSRRWSNLLSFNCLIVYIILLFDVFLRCLYLYELWIWGETIYIYKQTSVVKNLWFLCLYLINLLLCGIEFALLGSSFLWW